MTVRLRLQRRGAKKRPFYRIVAADSRTPRDGRFLEVVGTYDPTREPMQIRLNEDRVQHWLSVGARPSDTVASILRRVKRQPELLTSAGARPQSKGFTPLAPLPKEEPKAEAKPEKPKAEAKADEPKAEAKAEEPKAEAKADEPKAEAKADEPKAEAKADEPKAEAKADEPKAEAKADEPKAEAKADEAADAPAEEAKAEDAEAKSEEGGDA